VTKTMTGGEAIASAISAHGVDTVFALPGVQTYPLMDALKKAENSIRVIGPARRHGGNRCRVGTAVGGVSSVAAANARVRPAISSHGEWRG
jgi:acetolactate synthase-1/2/3 large subunit